MAQRKVRHSPGHLAPVSGIYSVIHAGDHRETHNVVVIRGEELSTCRTCKADVRFEVVDVVTHVRHDMDFAGFTQTVN